MDALEDEVQQVVHDWRARIQDLPGKHVGLEVIWDGGTAGWFLVVMLVTERRPERRGWLGTRTAPEYGLTEIGTLSRGGDLRLFNGEVPPWPEAIIAQRAGTQLARELGLVFCFASPGAPDDRAPHWCPVRGALVC